MEQPTPSEKTELYQLVDRLPAAEVRTARRFLEYLVFHQKDDDEPYSAAQQESDVQSLAEIEKGDGIAHEDMLRDFGL
jgi:hypothetical protein